MWNTGHLWPVQTILTRPLYGIPNVDYERRESGMKCGTPERHGRHT